MSAAALKCYFEWHRLLDIAVLANEISRYLLDLSLNFDYSSRRCSAMDSLIARDDILQPKNRLLVLVLELYVALPLDLMEFLFRVDIPMEAAQNFAVVVISVTEMANDLHYLLVHSVVNSSLVLEAAVVELQISMVLEAVVGVHWGKLGPACQDHQYAHLVLAQHHYCVAKKNNKINICCPTAG